MDAPTDLDVVRALLAEQAPQLAGADLREVPGGVDNAVVRVGAEHAVRLPRTAQAAQLTRHEHAWLGRLATGLPLQAPVPLVHGRPGAAFDRDWSLVPWIAGETADTAPYDPSALAADLQRTFALLHRPAPDDAPDNPFRRRPLAQRVARVRAALCVAPHPRADEVLDLLDGLARVPGHGPPWVWVHGDVHPRNLVVRDGVVVGLLDWGDLHGGDRAVDLACLWTLLERAARTAVLDALDVDGDTRQRARGWALCLGALYREVGAAQGHPGFVAAGDRALTAALAGD